jgi:hypothetical protein
MSKTHAASMAVGLGLLIFSGASFDVAAKSSGVAARPSQPTQSTPAPRPVAPGHHGAFRRFPLFGVASTPYWAPYYGLPDYLSGEPVDATVSTPEPPATLTCKRSQQVVSVPSWDGGMREVRITRC